MTGDTSGPCALTGGALGMQGRSQMDTDGWEGEANAVVRLLPTDAPGPSHDAVCSH